jgi:hypothetical protein
MKFSKGREESGLGLYRKLRGRQNGRNRNFVV